MICHFLRRIMLLDALMYSLFIILCAPCATSFVSFFAWITMVFYRKALRILKENDLFFRKKTIKTRYISLIESAIQESTRFAIKNKIKRLFFIWSKKHELSNLLLDYCENRNCDFQPAFEDGYLHLVKKARDFIKELQRGSSSKEIFEKHKKKIGY